MGHGKKREREWELKKNGTWEEEENKGEFKGTWEKERERDRSNADSKEL
jgi:hypothetical protein